MRRRLTIFYIYQILRAKWRPILISMLVALLLVGGLFFFYTPKYQSELLFQLKPNRGLGGEDDPYNILELSSDKSNNHIDNTIIILSSSLLYRRAADEFFPNAGFEEKDSLGVWLDDQISVSKVDNTTMLKLKCRSENPHLAQRLLNRFFRFMQEDDRLQYQRILTSSVRFLEDRIDKLSHEIGLLDSVNADFLVQSRAVNARSAFWGEWRDHMNYTNEEEKLEAELQVALFLQEYIKKALLEDGFIPYFRIRNGYVTRQIENYNQTWLVYDNLRKNASIDVGVLRDQQNKLDQLRRAVMIRLEAEIGDLQIRLQEIKSRIFDKEVSNLDVSKRLADSYMNRRMLKSKLNTYVHLSLRLEEVEIKRAIYESNWLLIEPATFDPVPVRSRFIFLLLFILLLGLVVPVIFFIIFDKLDYLIVNRKTLENFSNIRILESIPADGFQTEAFDRIRAEVMLRMRDVRVLFFTSTLPHEGKTYIARNLAISLSKADRKVVLIDADIRKATQSKELNLDRKIGVSTYLADEEQDLESIIIPVQGYPNLSLVPCGVIPPNPSELLAVPRWKLLIDQLHERYDYIVIDSVPAQLVADAVVAAKVADLSFYVMRGGMIDRRYLPELNRLFGETIFPNMYMIINGFENMDDLKDKI